MKPVFTRWIHHHGFTSKYYCYYYILPLNSKQATMGALLGRMLTRGSQDYPSLKAIRDRGDDLYGTVVYFDMNKYLDQLIFEAKLIMPNFALLGDEGTEEEAMDFFHSLLYRPLLDEEGNFSREIFEQEKEMLHQELDGLNKNPSSYAHRRCIELLFEGSSLGQYKYGDRATLKEIELEDIKEFYRSMIASSPLFVYRHGEEENRTEGEIPPYMLPPSPDEEMKRKKVEEEKAVSQSVLVESYRVPWQFRDERNHAMAVFSNLFGGYANSLLFRKVREERGLCYSIYTKYDKYRRLLLLLAGHEKAHHDELEKAIAQTLNAIRQGEFSLKEFEDAKQDLTIGLGALVDSQGQLIGYQFVQDFFGQTDSLQERIERIDNVTKEEVMAVAKEVTPALSFNLRQE